MLKFFILSLFCARLANADLLVNPRYDLVGSNQGTLVDRLMLKSTLDYKKNQWSFFADGFGELDAASEENKQFRRAPNTAYLQEAYAEYNLNSFYARVGRQAIRWSDSWTLPSLDVWTARRFNRLFIDPQPEQFIHSSGLLLSYSKSKYSLDLALISDSAQSVFPQTFAQVQPTEKETLDYGARFKADFSGVTLALITARVQKKNTTGLAANYALEKSVLKAEVGGTFNDQLVPVTAQREFNFATLGADIFISEWVLTPQLTVFETEDFVGSAKRVEGLAYFNILWTTQKNEILLQSFFNTQKNDAYTGLIYTYNFASSVSLSSYVQNYTGSAGTLTQDYSIYTGGWLGGVRAQYSGAFIF